MRATVGTYQIRSLAPYRHLFPAARVVDITVKKGADVSDTVDFIPQIVKATRWQVKQFVDAELTNLPSEKALEKLWYWVKCHIPYGPDVRGKEQVKSPRRIIRDAALGIGSDCDDMTNFVSACASWLEGIREIILSITKYGGKNWQHIYPTIILTSGKKIIMDCVTDAYNYEKPPTQKQDYSMELQYLDGIEDQDDLGALKIFKKAKEAVKKAGEAIKDNAGKVLHAVNKANPATVLLRNGVLASMKLNIMNVAGRLRWGYLSDDKLAKHGIDKSKHDKLKSVIKKLEEIFHGAGGETKNLKKAILEGKGNKDHSVAGLGSLNVYSTLAEVLGPEIYDQEGATIEGLGELGVVAATSVAAATGAIAAIATLLKQVGNIFQKGGAGAKDFEAGDKETPDGDGQNSTASLINNISSAVNTVKKILPAAAQAKQIASTMMQKPAAPPAPSATKESYDASQAEVDTNFSPQAAPGTQVMIRPTEEPGKNAMPVTTQGNTPSGDKKEDPKKRPAWVLPVAIGGGVLLVAGTAFLIYRAGQKRKLALSLVSKNTVNGTDDEMGYVLVEETSPHTSTSEVGALEGFEVKNQQPENSAPKKENYVLVEETKPAEEQLTAVPLM